MIDLRELAIEWEVDPEPLIKAVESAQRVRRHQLSQKPLIASAEPADCNHQLRQAHKAIAKLPLRAREHLHRHLADRIGHSFNGPFDEQVRRAMLGTANPYGLSAEQSRYMMEDVDLVGIILDALSEPVEREEPDRELQWLAEAWIKAGGEVLAEDGSHRYHEGLIEFLDIAYTHLDGEKPDTDNIRRCLDRIRRSPLRIEGVSAGSGNRLK